MGGVVASAASIVFAPVVAVIVMAAVVVANVPYAAYKEFRIVKLPGMCFYKLSYDVFYYMCLFLTVSSPSQD